MDEMKREHEARIDEMKREHEARMDVLERFLRVVQSEGIETRRQTRETVRLVGVMEKSLLRIHGRVERLEETGRKG